LPQALQGAEHRALNIDAKQGHSQSNAARSTNRIRSRFPIKLRVPRDWENG
jgi:hypothetical protein